jgi:hypothetical protein
MLIIQHINYTFIVFTMEDKIETYSVKVVCSNCEEGSGASFTDHYFVDVPVGELATEWINFQKCRKCLNRRVLYRIPSENGIDREDGPMPSGTSGIRRGGLR